jgi:hypothetical protein
MRHSHRGAVLTGLVALAMLTGAAVAIASSPASFSRTHAPASSLEPAPTASAGASPATSPTPSSTGTPGAFPAVP